MHIERLVLTNFRCFGSEPATIWLDDQLTAFVGANGAGKTAVMHALLRLFGVIADQRRLRRQDFHVPANEEAPPSARTLVLEAYLAFPELDEDGDAGDAVPEFFQQMAANDDGHLKCRLRLEATWTDDGSTEGAIDQKYWAVRTLTPDFEETDCTELKALDRNRIQMIYVPAMRDGTSQIASFLKGRLWRAIQWSEGVRNALTETGEVLNKAFTDEAGLEVISEAVKTRWQEVHTAGTDTTPIFRPVDLRFQEFVRKVEVMFHPDEAGRERSLEELSDGQRSLFHIAMTAATLDIEGKIAAEPGLEGFQPGGLALPALTLIAVEEPENNLAPFYLSRIIRQVEDLTAGPRAQAVLSSHSASIMARVDPTQVRHFRLDTTTRVAHVNEIEMPEGDEDASKYVREAVRTFPELYFARFVILGEGSSEEVVLPRLAEAMGLPIDRSFIAVVPLGGRHVNHLWRLLSALEIPHATLLDLDHGRAGGGYGRIKDVIAQLLAVGHDLGSIVEANLVKGGAEKALATIAAQKPDLKGENQCAAFLRRFGVFFCSPLDLDWSMLAAFSAAYQTLDADQKGPAAAGDAKSSVLGNSGDGTLYDNTNDTLFRWYRYLFLGRGKPSTHVRVLSRLDDEALVASAPEELTALLQYVQLTVFGPPAAAEAEAKA